EQSTPSIATTQPTANQAGDKLRKLQRKTDKASDKLVKTQSKLSKQKRIAIARATDAVTGKTAVKLRFDEKVKPPSKLYHEGGPSIGAEIHREIDKNEDDNSGVKAAHSTEKSAEKGVRFANSSYRARKLKAYRHAEKAEQALDQANLHVQYQKAQLSSNPVSRWQQKRAIRKSYAAAKAAGSLGQGTGTLNVVDRAKAGVKAIVTSNKRSMVLGGLLFFMLAMLMNGLSSCTPMIQGGLQALVIATYPADDEFQYELDDIWHDPHALLSLVSAHANGEWKIDGVCGFMDRLFEKQYTITETVKTETRYRKEWVMHHYKEVDLETGAVTWVPYEVEEDVPYDYYICTVTLDNFNLSHLPFYVLSREGVGRYAMYISVLGNQEDLFRGNPYASTHREPGKHEVPEESLENETFRRILEEAEKYIGYPYVWGGDSPETSFDCSGFVSYVFTNSGVRNVGRLGATSLYGACRKISPDEAKPGDLIFFEKTIPGEDGITHVGIYVGNGFMLHCGSPIGYADLSESYWQ
ncbi:MAG: C40 family peptidase, partial [Clostridia bacterium]